MVRPFALMNEPPVTAPAEPHGEQPGGAPVVRSLRDLLRPLWAQRVSTWMRRARRCIRLSLQGQRAPPARSAQRLSSPPVHSHRLRPATTSSKQRLVSPPPQLGAEPSLPPGSPRTRRHLRMHDTPQRSPLPFETLRQRAPRTARRPTPRPPPPTTLSATASSPQSPQLALALASDSLPEDANPHRLAQLAAPLRSATRAGPPSSTSQRQECRQFLRDRLPPPRQGVPSPSSSCDASGSPSTRRHPRPHRPTSTPFAYAAPSAGRPLI